MRDYKLETCPFDLLMEQMVVAAHRPQLVPVPMMLAAISLSVQEARIYHFLLDASV